MDRAMEKMLKKELKPTDFRMPEEEYRQLLKDVMDAAEKRMGIGYRAYGDTIHTPSGEFAFFSEIIEEISDSINYLVMALYKMRAIKSKLEV